MIITRVSPPRQKRKSASKHTHQFREAYTLPQRECIAYFSVPQGPYIKFLPPPPFPRGKKPPPTPEKFMPTCCCQAEAFPALFSSPFFSPSPAAFDRSPPPPPLPRYSSCLANFALFSPSYPARTQTAGKWYGIQQRCLQAFDILNVFARATNLKSHVCLLHSGDNLVQARHRRPPSLPCAHQTAGGKWGGKFVG